MMEARKSGLRPGSLVSGVAAGASARVRCVPFVRVAQIAVTAAFFAKLPSLETDPHNFGPPADISREVVGLLKSLVGRGPTKSKTYIHDDCVVILLREGHTRGEETMFGAGSGRAVAQGRVDMSETIRAPLTEVIERHTGRKVTGFMSSSQQDPDLISFVFVLDTSPLVAVVDDDAERSD